MLLADDPFALVELSHRFFKQCHRKGNISVSSLRDLSLRLPFLFFPSSFSCGCDMRVNPLFLHIRLSLKITCFRARFSFFPRFLLAITRTSRRSRFFSHQAARLLFPLPVLELWYYHRGISSPVLKFSPSFSSRPPVLPLPFTVLRNFSFPDLFAQHSPRICPLAAPSLSSFTLCDNELYSCPALVDQQLAGVVARYVPIFLLRFSLLTLSG